MSEPENPVCALDRPREPMSDAAFERVLEADSWGSACATAHQSGGFVWCDVVDKMRERERAFRWATRLAIWRRIKLD